MLNNFDLFLYVSKAERGPLAQRLYVFRKESGEDLVLVYDWAASTGRERQEVSPRGRRALHRHAARLLPDRSAAHVSQLPFLQLGPAHAPCHVLRLGAQGCKPAPRHSRHQRVKPGKAGSARQRRLRAPVARECRDTLQSHPRRISRTGAALCLQRRQPHDEQRRCLLA